MQACNFAEQAACMLPALPCHSQYGLTKKQVLMWLINKLSTGRCSESGTCPLERSPATDCLPGSELRDFSCHLSSLAAGLPRNLTPGTEPECWVGLLPTLHSDNCTWSNALEVRTDCAICNARFHVVKKHESPCSDALMGLHSRHIMCDLPPACHTLSAFHMCLAGRRNASNGKLALLSVSSAAKNLSQANLPSKTTNGELRMMIGQCRSSRRQFMA